MNTILLHTDRDSDYAEQAAALLRSGELVVIPTETVYGLAANALDENAVKKIYEAKGRPSDNPLIVHIADLDSWYPLVQSVPEKALALAKAFWPGPLTIILPKSRQIPAATSGGLDTVAVRMPSHPAAAAVIRACGLPLAAPSANISGFPSPTKAEYAIDDMTGRVPMILDGGDCDVGVESTVITLAGEIPTVLRPGGVTPEQLRQVIGEVRVDDAVLHPLKQNETAASPGMKYRHYSPKAEIAVYCGTEKGYYRYLHAHSSEGIFALCFAENAAHSPVPAVTFGSRQDALSQTRRLFDALRELDEQGARRAIAVCPEREGIGLAVCNRLFRAAGFAFIREAPIVGLTGQTGSGKTAAAACFAQQGFAVIDCDAIARTVTEKDSPVLSGLAEAFGKDILLADGSLDRKALAEKAFSSEENTEKLNRLTHPAILEKTKEQALAASRQNIPCVIDAPLLFQCGLDALCDVTVCITAPRELRIRRLQNRDALSAAAIQGRMHSQPEESYYTDRADIIIHNAPPGDLEKQITQTAERILKTYEA